MQTLLRFLFALFVFWLLSAVIYVLVTPALLDYWIKSCGMERELECSVAHFIQQWWWLAAMCLSVVLAAVVAFTSRRVAA